MTACRNGLTRIGTYGLMSVVLIGACSDTSRPPVSRQSATDILDELDRKRRERESRTKSEILTELRATREDGDEEEATDWFAVTPDNDATARARRIEAAESAAAARRAQQRADRRARAAVGAHALPWYEGGTLHSATGRQWLAAPARNRLATAADFVASAWHRDGYTEQHIGQMVLNGFLRAAAEEQVDCITRRLNESAAREWRVASIAAVCYLED